MTARHRRTANKWRRLAQRIGAALLALATLLGLAYMVVLMAGHGIDPRLQQWPVVLTTTVTTTATTTDLNLINPDPAAAHADDH